MVSLEFLDPSGAIEVKQPHAPRLSTLEGKRIGFVSNEQWQAYRMLPRLKVLLEADFPGIEVLPIDAFPQGNAVIGSEETASSAARSSRRRLSITCSPTPSATSVLAEGHAPGDRARRRPAPQREDGAAHLRRHHRGGRWASAEA